MNAWYAHLKLHVSCELLQRILDVRLEFCHGSVELAMDIFAIRANQAA